MRKERLEMVRAMEKIARCVNDETVFAYWLEEGVADNDGNLTDEDLAYYCEDENFAGLMRTFLFLMVEANHSGGLYCDNIVCD